MLPTHLYSCFNAEPLKIEIDLLSVYNIPFVFITSMIVMTTRYATNVSKAA